jgi:tRNA 2-thiouridine synthesizing protein A
VTGDRPVGGGPDEPAEVLDCLGQRCPLPVIALARRLPQLPVGAVLRLLADDPAAAGDVAAWCRMRRQDLVAAAPPSFDVRRVT